LGSEAAIFREDSLFKERFLVSCTEGRIRGLSLSLPDLVIPAWQFFNSRQAVISPDLGLNEIGQKMAVQDYQAKAAVFDHLVQFLALP
jgi:hypothetical protein